MVAPGAGQFRADPLLTAAPEQLPSLATFAPRAFTPGVVHVEERFPEAVRDDPAERGHLLEVQPPWSLGRLCAAGFTRAGLVRAAATPRFMQAYAVGR